MNISNYDYPPPSGGYDHPYSSTPSNAGSHRPRFGYSGSSSYPRPRSSATKPNPDSYKYYGDSMYNNHGNTADSYNSDLGCSYDKSNSNYYSASESFYHNTLPPETPEGSYFPNTLSSDKLMGRMDSNRIGHNNKSMNKISALPSVYPSSGLSQFEQNKFTYTGVPTFSSDIVPGQKFKGYKNNQQFPGKRFGKPKKAMASQGMVLRCQLCSLDFTSQIPYDMHLRGARHAKKLKASQVSPAIQAQAGVGISGEQTFYCSVCDVKANSPLQYQMHLEGTKHKNKLNPKEPPAPNQMPEVMGKKKKHAKTVAPADSIIANGSVTRPLPADFEEPQKAKLMKFACDICNVTVNSDTQLQQHLVSKKHQFKVEGKPLPKKPRKQNAEGQDTDTVMNDLAAEIPAGNAPKGEMVMGVKTLSSSFVKGGTIV